MKDKNQGVNSWKILAIILGIIVILFLVAGAMGGALFGLRHMGGRESGMMGHTGKEITEMARGEGFGGRHMFFGRISGQVTSISGDQFKIKTPKDEEITVEVKDTTSVYNQGKIASKGDIKENNSVTVTGRPDSSGVVQANVIFIR